jgi:hypothetical protein
VTQRAPAAVRTVLPAQALRVTQVFGAGDGGEDPGAHGCGRSHPAEGQCGVGESLRAGRVPPGAANPAVTAVPAAVPPLKRTLERKKLRPIPAGEHDRARGSCRVSVAAGAPGTQHRLVDAVGHEHPIDRRGLPAFVLPQRLPLRHRFTSTRVGHAFGPVPAGHRLRGMRTATPSAVFGKPFGSLGRTV